MCISGKHDNNNNLECGMSCRIMSCLQNDRRVPSQIIFAEAGTSDLIEVKLPSLQPKTEAPGTFTEKWRTIIVRTLVQETKTVISAVPRRIRAGKREANSFFVFSLSELRGFACYRLWSFPFRVGRSLLCALVSSDFVHCSVRC